LHSSPRQEHIDASKVFPVRLAARTTLLPHAATHHDSVVLLPLESVHGVNRNPVLNAFRGGGLSQLQYFLALAFMGVTPTDTRNATRCKSSVSRWISVSCSPWATTSSGAVAEGLETRSRRACGDACDDMVDVDLVVAGGVETRTRSRAPRDT
jgi:hypothetical protein